MPPVMAVPRYMAEFDSEETVPRAWPALLWSCPIITGSRKPPTSSVAAKAMVAAQRDGIVEASRKPAPRATIPDHREVRSPILATSGGPANEPIPYPRPMIIMETPISVCVAPKSLASQEPMNENAPKQPAWKTR